MYKDFAIRFCKAVVVFFLFPVLCLVGVLYVDLDADQINHLKNAIQSMSDIYSVIICSVIICLVGIIFASEFESTRHDEKDTSTVNKT